MLFQNYGTDWPTLCWFAVEKLLTGCRLKGRCTGQSWHYTCMIMTTGNRSVFSCWSVSLSWLRRATAVPVEPPGWTAFVVLWSVYCTLTQTQTNPIQSNTSLMIKLT